MKNREKEKSSFLIVLLSSGFYSGFSPLAPGTAGTAVGVLLYLFVSHFSLIFYILVTIALFFAGIWLSSRAEVIFGKKDAGNIVIDEIEGFFITMLFVPKTATFIILGFLLFRILDIVKPFSRIQRLEGGLGVMIDDAIAAVIANILLQFLRIIV
jgi:phosphatidylglycerophosphatase A